MRSSPSRVCEEASEIGLAASSGKERAQARRRTICFAMSVLATIALNSSKSSLPSPFWSASIMAEIRASQYMMDEMEGKGSESLLSTICCSCWSCRATAGSAGTGPVSLRREEPQRAPTHLQVVSDHHLEHQEKLSIRDEAVPVHVVHLERDCEPKGQLLRLLARLRVQQLTPELLFPLSSTAESTQTSHKLLEVDCSSSAARVERRRVSAVALRAHGDRRASASAAQTPALLSARPSESQAAPLLHECPPRLVMTAGLCWFRLPPASCAASTATPSLAHPCHGTGTWNASLLLVKDGNHPARERVVGNLRNLKELVLVDRARSVLVELHETLLQPLDLNGRDYER